MRLVSFSPAATEWVTVLRAGDLLVARLHVGDGPTDTHADTYTDTHADTYNDTDLAELLVELEPDLVLSDPTSGPTEKQFSEIAQLVPGKDLELILLDSPTFSGLLKQVLHLGRLIHHSNEVMAYIAERESRIKAMRERLGITRRTSSETLPTVACFTSVKPLRTSEYWVAELIELAGGHPVLADGGLPPQSDPLEAVAAADPDLIVFAPAGCTIEQARAQIYHLTEHPSWRELSAVQNERVYVLDGRTYLNGPGPWLYRCIELLAVAIHGANSGIRPESCELENLRTQSRPAI